MQLILIGAVILLVPTLVVAGLLYLILWVSKRRPERYWRRVGLLHLVLLPIYAFLVVPGGLGFIAPKFVDTRPDERAYAGPRIDDEGTWWVQTRDTLASEERGLVEVDPGVNEKARELAVSFTSMDGTELQAYVVQPLRPDPLLSVVMVHGLFRNAMELETVGAMFRRYGAEVLLLELRNHGGSGSDGAFTFGAKESEDVEAAVRYLLSRPGRAEDPIVLFGVSLGTAAVALAAPRVPNLAGVVLDAPMDNLLATAHRMLSESRGRVPLISEPFRSIVIKSIEWSSGFRMSAVRPIDELATLPADLPILLIAAGRDERMPPDSVSRIYETLQAPPGVKELWIVDEARHGHVWDEDRDGYEERIARFVPMMVDGR